MNMNFSDRRLRGCIWMVAAAVSWNLLSVFAVPAQNAQKSSAISKAIISAIQTQWSLDGPQYEISLRRNPFLSFEFDKPGAFDSIAITPLTSKHPRGAFPMMINIYDGGRIIRHGQASAYVKAFDSALVAEKKESKGAPGTDLALSLQFMETTNIPDEFISNKAELIGLRLRRNVRRGDVLTRSRLEPIPDVDFGQEVVIEYIGGALTMSAAGSALQKGITGETVRVRNLSSRKIIKAVVAGPGLVRISVVGLRGRSQ